jgi:hypothetical protein
MLHSDPVARASLDEVLNHPWMNSPAFRWCPSVLTVGADVPKHAALKWPDQVDRKWFYRIAALDSRNGDNAWRSLTDALELVSRLCERNGGDSQGHDDLRHTSHMSRLSGGVRELPDRTLSLLGKVRSRAVLDWSIPVLPLGKRRTKTEELEVSGQFQAPVAYAILYLHYCTCRRIR